MINEIIMYNKGAIKTYTTSDYQLRQDHLDDLVNKAILDGWEVGSAVTFADEDDFITGNIMEFAKHSYDAWPHPADWTKDAPLLVKVGYYDNPAMKTFWRTRKFKLEDLVLEPKEC